MPGLAQPLRILMPNETDRQYVSELIFGRWRSQIAYAAVELRVLENLSVNIPRSAEDVASKIGARDALILYRLMRAVASIGLADEDAHHRFVISPAGQMLLPDHPQSLQAMLLLEEGPAHYAIWKHLPAIVRDGVQDGFSREYGMPVFDYLKENENYARVFQQAMSNYSANEALSVCTALQRNVTWHVESICDVGGGDGSLLAEVLKIFPHSRGIVLDLPEVVAQRQHSAKARSSDDGRLRHVGGNMFDAVPNADLYLVKHVLHDWDDAECRKILQTLRASALASSRLYISEMVVPPPHERHFSKIFDMHMLCASTGKQRTISEFAQLLSNSGWTLEELLPADDSPLRLIAAKVSDETLTVT